VTTAESECVCCYPAHGRNAGGTFVRRSRRKFSPSLAEHSRVPEQSGPGNPRKSPKSGISGVAIGRVEQEPAGRSRTDPRSSMVSSRLIKVRSRIPREFCLAASHHIAEKVRDRNESHRRWGIESGKRKWGNPNRSCSYCGPGLYSTRSFCHGNVISGGESQTDGQMNGVAPRLSGPTAEALHRPATSATVPARWLAPGHHVGGVYCSWPGAVRRG